MPLSNRQQTRTVIELEKASAIIRTQNQTLAHDAMQAAVEGGFRLVEFTLTTPGALELITTFSNNTNLTVGAGTVMTTEQAKQAVSAGARFLVSPIIDKEVITQAADLDVVCIPGAQTPTEMETAYRFGADFIKVFPAPAGGIDFIRAIRGPLPHLRLFPTAGVTPDNIIEYLEAGCAGAGFVRTLFDPDDLTQGRFENIRLQAHKITESVRKWRKQSND